MDDNIVYMKTTRGPQRVDVIYRRVDDDFSTRWSSGPTRRWACRAWSTPTAPATSRSPTPSAPASPTTRLSTPMCRSIIEYYLGEEPILPNVETYLGSDPEAPGVHPREPGQAGRQGRQRVRRLRDADGAAGERGGAGEFAEKIKANPRNYIAQPLISLSTAPRSSTTTSRPRHVDLRPFILYGQRTASRSFPAG